MPNRGLYSNIVFHLLHLRQNAGLDRHIGEKCLLGYVAQVEHDTVWVSLGIIIPLRLGTRQRAKPLGHDTGDKFESKSSSFKNSKTGAAGQTVRVWID